MDASNDNRPAPPSMVRVVGFVGGDGAVTITDPTWRPTPRPAPQLLDHARDD